MRGHDGDPFDDEPGVDRFGPQPCGRFVAFDPLGPPPGLDHPKVRCFCQWAWQLHREAAGGPDRATRTELMERDRDQARADGWPAPPRGTPFSPNHPLEEDPC